MSENMIKKSGTYEVSGETVMRRFDRESNTRIWTGKPKVIVNAAAVLFSLYSIYCALFAVMLDEVRLTSFIGSLIILGYLTYPACRHNVRENSMPWYDFTLMILGAGSFFHFCFNADAIVMRLPLLKTYEAVIGVIGLISIFELCRRCTGIPIMAVAGSFMIYALYYYGVKKGQGAGAVKSLICRLFYLKTGMLSTPANVCSKYIAIFIIFGAFLERTGISDFFISLANAIAGSSVGGPAKVAVISSALCGMVSGSSVGNTVTTGSVTIPMMKRTGYDADFAGAVEAAASTGGQIMPPILGAAAFLMTDFLGIPYSGIALRAILPAVLYFTGIFIAVHLEAKKQGLTGLAGNEIPRIAPLIRKAYLLAPLVVLMWLVSSNSVTMAFAAAVSIVAAVIVSLFNKEQRITPKVFLEALAAGGRGCISVGVACCIAGIVSGCLTMTGLANQIFASILDISENAKFIALFLTMICCIILGMGVPTTANYCIMATTCAPILIRMGISDVAAHFFVFYFGIVADITPPVALAAYAGAAISRGNPIKTAVNATKLAIAAFIIPYIMAYNPAMVLVDTNALEIVQIVITSLIGMFGIAAALNGFLFCTVSRFFRIMLLAGGLLMMVPGTQSDAAGLVFIAVVAAWQRHKAKANAYITGS